MLGRGRLDGFRAVARPYLTEKNYVSLGNFSFFQLKLGSFRLVLVKLD